MSEKAKKRPKSKNRRLSLEKLEKVLANIRLLYPENEAFVRGESEAVYPRDTVINNICSYK